ARGELEQADHAVRAGGDLRLLFRGAVRPDADRVVGSGSRDGAVVRRYGQAIYRPGVRHERPVLAESPPAVAPDLHLAGDLPGEQPAAVRGKGHRGDLAGGRQCAPQLELLAAHDPDKDLIAAGRGDVLAVRGDGQRG